MARPPNPRRVVVTGTGLVLATGRGRAGADAIFEGRTAVEALRGMPGLSNLAVARVADHVPPSGTETADRAVALGADAAEQAWAEADLVRHPPDSRRVAVVFSLSKGGMQALARWAAAAEHGPPESPDAIAPMDALADAAGRLVAARFGIRGPVPVPVTACASGGHALVWGARMIQRGVVDVALVGAAEASIEPLVLGSYRRLGVLAPASDDPAAAVRPFAANRSGFAIGEGAGALVLEATEHAAERGARALAGLGGWAVGCHAAGLAEMETSGLTMVRLATLAMDRSGIGPADVDYVHAHGTATASNDAAEARAIRAALGEAAGAANISSTKGAHGHLLGAATAVELVLTVLAIERGEVPPTANLHRPDPEIDLDCTPLVPVPRKIRHALKLASGFGGQSIAVCLRAEDQAR